MGGTADPISAVRSSSKRLRTPDILTPSELEALVLELSQRERVMALLAGSTGVRRGELMALRWRDVDFQLSQANVTHSIGAMSRATPKRRRLASRCRFILL